MEKIFCIINDYFPQVLTIFGTLLGTILGWFLKYLQDNIGRTEIFIMDFNDYKDKNETYAYNLELFICNHALKPKYMYDLKIVYYCNKQFIFSENMRNCGDKSTFINISSKKIIQKIHLKYNEPIIVNFCDLFPIKNIEKADSIFFVYKNERGKEKKEKIKTRFSVKDIKKYDKADFF